MSALTSGHHAVLFALIAQQMLQLAGPTEGERVIRQGVRRYGEQRGRRMALRAQAAGDPLDVQSYFKYGEWQAGPGEMEQAVLETSPQTRQVVARCLWNQTWRENHLLPYGRLYCLEIDAALMRGFNPALSLEVRSTLSGGEEQCDFVFGGDLHPAGLGVKLGVKPWAYHLAHLFATMAKTAAEAWGPDGRQAVDRALAEFSGRFGPEARDAILAWINADFDQV